MTSIDMAAALASLAERRPLFHSEADFQHALAWTLQEQDPARRIRLEYRADVEQALYLDILVTDAFGSRTAIELKYWTKALTTSIDGEEFRLRDQGAQDICRYDFVKDLTRIEQLVRAGLAERGWVVALTNDPSYWSASTRPDTADAAFRLSDGKTLTGRLAWGDRAGAGTTRGRTAVHELAGNYQLGWRDFSNLPVSRAGELRYLALHVGAPDEHRAG